MTSQTTLDPNEVPEDKEVTITYDGEQLQFTWMKADGIAPNTVGFYNTVWKHYLEIDTSDRDYIFAF